MKPNNEKRLPFYLWLFLMTLIITVLTCSCSTSQLTSNPELSHHDNRDGKVLKVEEKVKKRKTVKWIFVTYDSDTTTGQWVRVSSGNDYKVGNILPHNPLLDFSR